ncbi:hypothetical protein M758_1G293000 [Ceratodon purpureus]|nr:hypothetical protein M758_1G293000 [Ceratodon purpureus]
MWPLCDAQSRGLQHEGFEVVYRVMACRECLVCDTLIKFLGRSIKAYKLSCFLRLRQYIYWGINLALLPGWKSCSVFCFVLIKM